MKIKATLGVAFTLLTICCKAQVRMITTIAGCDTAGYNGDSIIADSACLNFPESLYLDPYGNIYIADAGNNRIRRINVGDGKIVTVAGTGAAGFSGDNAAATSAELYAPTALVANDSDVYFADALNNRIRKINLANGIITTIAGNGVGGSTGDGALALNSEINGPCGLCFDRSGGLIIAEYYGHVVRRIDLNTGIINKVAGTGISGYSGDGGQGSDATFHGPVQVFADLHNNILICDYWNHALRKVDAATGIISTIAGNGTPGYSGNGGLAKDALLTNPSSVFVDKYNNIFFTEYDIGTVMRIDAGTKIITVIAGTGVRGYSGDGGPATDAQLKPDYVYVTDDGTMFIADYGNSRIRKIHSDVSVGSEPNTSGFQIYPNPSNGVFTITAKSLNGTMQADVFDVTGARVSHFQISMAHGNTPIKLDVPPGLYCIRLTDIDGISVMQKVVVE